MLRSRLFWKLFLGFTAVNLLAIVSLVAATWSWQRDEARATLQRELATAAAVIADAATRWSVEPSDAVARELDAAARRAELDIAVTSSGRPPLRIDAAPAPSSGAQRIEAKLTLESGGARVGSLRVSRSGDALAATLAKLWLRYVWFAPLAALAMVAAGYGLVAHLVGPVRALLDSASAMARGDYAQRAFVTNRDELGLLAKSFNRMSEELGRRLGELEESDRRQSTVLGGMIEGVIAIDARSRVLLANPAAGALFGFEPAVAVGRPLIEAVRNDSLHQAGKSALATRTPQRLEVQWGDRVLSVQVTPLVGERVTGAVVVLHDTTELRRLENLRRDFVANVSHELKTPLSIVRANAETLIRGAVHDEEFRTKFLDGIVEQSERLSDLIQDMLNLARIESAQQPFEIRSVSISDAVGACLRDHGQRAEAKRIDLSAADANGHSELRVRADREGLRVILNNLVDNAIKYTPDGGAVRVTWRASDDPRPGMVVVEVTDTGLGIPAAKLGRVFERFYRTDDARSRDLGGAGLGLSIVKHLVQSFGGSVSVENGAERGARFAVTLPAASGANAPG